LDAARTPPSRPARILLVDDEETVRRVTGRLLEKLGYRVRAAGDADEALALLRDGERFDLVVTDVVMPGLSGIEMAERMRHLLPDQRILFTSGYTTREFGRPPGEPPQPFMPKPFSLDDLERAVNGALAGDSQD
jgi:two-component system cell cycle sensor histidine kinase/response regulator CckA